MKIDGQNSYADVLIRVGGEKGEDVMQYHLPRSTVLATTSNDWDGHKTTFEVSPIGQYTAQLIPGPITLAAQALWEDKASRNISRPKGGWANLTQATRDEWRRRAKLALEAAGEL